MLGFREGDILRDPFRKVVSHSLHPLPFIKGGDSIFKNLEKGSGLKKVSENRGREGGGGEGGGFSFCSIFF